MTTQCNGDFWRETYRWPCACDADATDETACPCQDGDSEVECEGDCCPCAPATHPRNLHVCAATWGNDSSYYRRDTDGATESAGYHVTSPEHWAEYVGLPEMWEDETRSAAEVAADLAADIESNGAPVCEHNLADLEAALELVLPQ